MRAITMTEMGQHTKERYNFAMSSFSRMYGVNRVKGSEEITRFCIKWAYDKDTVSPSGTLTDIDFYFLDFWKTWGGYL